MSTETNAPGRPVEERRERDKQVLTEMLLTSPRTGKPLTISSELQKQTDNSLRFTATSEDGAERWGVVFGVTELVP